MIRQQVIFAAALIASAQTGRALAADSWGGKVTISGSTITLENSVMKVVWQEHNYGGAYNVPIMSMVDKRNNIDHGGNDGVGAMWCCGDQVHFKRASVLKDDETGITVKVEADYGSQTGILYKNSSYMKIHYEENGSNIVDIANPGGGGAATKWIFYGQQAYGRDPADFSYEKCYYSSGDGYCTGMNGVPDKPADALLYNNNFIFGVYDVNRGNGYGRVMPKTLSIIKCLPMAGKGFEMFWGATYDGYIYLINGSGATGMIETGKKLVDGKFSEIDPASIAQPARRLNRSNNIRIQQNAAGLISMTIGDPSAAVCDIRGRTIHAENIGPNASFKIVAGVYCYLHQPIGRTATEIVPMVR